MTHARLISAMDLTALANHLGATYWQLVAQDAPAPTLDALYVALAALDELAGGLTSPSVRETLDPP